eukprot:40574-Pyramimonas_sp.AAC.1
MSRVSPVTCATTKPRKRMAQGLLAGALPRRRRPSAGRARRRQWASTTARAPGCPPNLDGPHRPSAPIRPGRSWPARRAEPGAAVQGCKD